MADDTARSNEKTISEFRANHGRVGGPFEGAPLLLLHTIGARTGTPRVHPLMYLPDQGRYLVFASRGGSDRNPDWYLNLLAHPDARVEVGDDVVEVHAAELTGQERDERYRDQARLHPGYAAYQRNTSRIIPVVALTPTSASARPGTSGSRMRRRRRPGRGRPGHSVPQGKVHGGRHMQRGGGEDRYGAVLGGDQQLDLGAAEDDAFGAGGRRAER